MAVIEVEGLTKAYGRLLAVHEVSFDVGEGEIFGFLGPNGAGKTTTINMLTTLIRPTAGRASVAGFDIVKEQSGVRQNVGLVPQDLTSDPELTGMENIMLQAAMYGVSKEAAKRRALELLELVGLDEVAQRRVETYSGGMRRRLEFAEGLIHSPRVLILDEPTLGLDVQTRTVLWDYVLRIRGEMGVTVFMTTHYMEEADRYCDRVAIIHRGRIRAIDNPSRLKEKAENDVVEIVMLHNSAEIGGVLQGVRGVLEVKRKGATYFATVSSGREGLVEIFEAVGKAGLKPERISLLPPSLDSVFLKLTGATMSKVAEESFDARRFRRGIKRVRRGMA